MIESLFSLTACFWLAASQTRYHRNVFGRALRSMEQRILQLGGWGLLLFSLVLWASHISPSTGLSIGIMQLGLMATIPLLLLIRAPKSLVPLSAITLTISVGLLWLKG